MSEDVLSSWRLAKHNHINVNLHDEERYRAFVSYLLKTQRNLRAVENILEEYHEKQTQALKEEIQNMWLRICTIPGFWRSPWVWSALYFVRSQSLASLNEFLKEYLPEDPDTFEPPPGGWSGEGPKSEFVEGCSFGIEPEDQGDQGKEPANQEDQNKKSTALPSENGSKECDHNSTPTTAQDGPSEPERTCKRPCKMRPKKKRFFSEAGFESGDPNHHPSTSESSYLDPERKSKRPRKASDDLSEEQPSAPSRANRSSSDELDKRRPPSSELVHGLYLPGKSSAQSRAEAPNTTSKVAQPSEKTQSHSESSVGRPELKRKRHSTDFDDAEEGPLNAHPVKGPDPLNADETRANDADDDTRASKRLRPSPEKTDEELPATETYEASMFDLFGEDIEEDEASTIQPADTSEDKKTDGATPNEEATTHDHTPSTTTPYLPQPADPSSSSPHPRESASPASPASH